MTIIAILVTIATALAAASLTYGIHNHRHIRDLDQHRLNDLANLANHVRRGHSGTAVTWVDSHPPGHQLEPNDGGQK
jgi:hypothetical protein